MKAIGEPLASDWIPNSEAFEKVARYYPEMDFILYLNEDCSYRAERVDGFLTVLWHSHEDRMVGIKLKGFRFLFRQLQAILDGVQDCHFLPLVKALEIALVGGVAEAMMDGVRKDRTRELYNQAKKFAAAENAGWHVNDNEFAFAVAA